MTDNPATAYFEAIYTAESNLVDAEALAAYGFTPEDRQRNHDRLPGLKATVNVLMSVLTADGHRAYAEFKKQKVQEASSKLTEVMELSGYSMTAEEASEALRRSIEALGF